jgi:hypothetical protein
VQLAKDETTHVLLRAACPRGGAVVLRDADAPGWQVSVDGAPAVALRADGLFRAVVIGPGSHEVTWQYTPGSWPWTPFVAGLAWLALAAWLWLAHRRASRSAAAAT